MPTEPLAWGFQTLGAQKRVVFRYLPSDSTLVALHPTAFRPEVAVLPLVLGSSPLKADRQHAFSYCFQTLSSLLRTCIGHFGSESILEGGAGQEFQT